MAIYLVGGAVRDLLLNVQPNDYDYVFSEEPAVFLAKHPKAKKVGLSHSVFIYHGHEYSPMFGGDILADLENRDFTIDALALDEQGRLYCHPKTLTDLKDKILRAVSPQSFLKDPVRIFRLARFLAKDPTFTVTAETLSLLQDFPRELLATQAKERVAHELLRALATDHPEEFFLFLAQHNFLRPWFSELDLAQNIPAGPSTWHESDVFHHTLEVLAKVHGDPLTCWMALCHDLGKIKTPKEILPHHYKHEIRGTDVALEFSQRLGMPKRYEKAGVLAAADHMRGGLYLTMRVGSRRDLIWRVKCLGLVDEFWRLVDADSHKEISVKAKAELEIISRVRLPEEFRDLGERSSEIFRQLQCQELAHNPQI